NQLDIGETPGEGVHSAVDYIEDLRQAQNLENLPVGRRVVVIGGGSTAIDIAVQSKKLGAEDVTMVYRRGPEQMSATDVEQEFAQVNDVRIRTWLQPDSWMMENGRLSGIRFEYTEPDSSGKLTGKSEFLEIDADCVFLALGQKMMSDIFDLEMEMNSGKLAVDEQGATSQSGIWAGGDCIRSGEDLTVHAVEQGKQAAIAMDQWLRN
ncbi:MAG: FAD-dependent oxidoreductase, partial [SAR324 cluster bacterium]|nr:FAD-dependent oxidoreductase [SAR324 cluster bacterium]